MDLVYEVRNGAPFGGHVEFQGRGEGCGQQEVVLALQELHGVLQDLLGGLLHYADEDLVLALEAVVEASVEDPRLVDDVAGGGLLVSLLQEQLQRHLRDLLARELALLLHRGSSIGHATHIGISRI